MIYTSPPLNTIARRVGRRWLALSTLLLAFGAVRAGESIAPWWMVCQGPYRVAAREVLGRGIASFYGYEFAGRPTAIGHTFDPLALTAASRSIPCGTVVRVICEETGRSVVCIINDRGPYVAGRILDCSLRVARELGIETIGVAHVEIEEVR